MANKDDTVEPVKSVDDAPKAQEDKPKSTGEICWNCKNQDPKTKNRLDDSGVCETCGFEKENIYNGNLEAEKAKAQ